MIEGGPGMGKTTLAINICKCWAKDELLQGYDAVVLLTLRDPEIQASKTIGDLLLIPDDKIRDNVLKKLYRAMGRKFALYLKDWMNCQITSKILHCLLN